MDTTSVAKGDLREKVLREAIDRHNNEDMDMEERLELRDRIARLRKKAEKARRAR